MRDYLDSIIPICFENDRGHIGQIGSGVLIDFRGTTFILTAGHVIDAQEKGSLMIPSGNNVISGIDGTFAYYQPLTNRTEDVIDVGYFKLDCAYAKKVKEVFEPITEQGVIRTNNISEYELFSFSGYPHRKSKSWNGKVKTEMYSYGTYLATPMEYNKYGCSINSHIVAKFDRRNSIDLCSGKRDNPPLPHGISGGGIFAWPEKIDKIPPVNRKLIGICHTYKEKDNCMIGTNIDIFLKSITHNNPSLRLENEI